jgi:hypothetical protein
MPSAEAVSHRQQAMRIAINTEFLALIRPQLIAGGLVFRSVSKSRLHAVPAGHCRHLAGNLRAKESGGIDLPAWPVAVRGLNSKANQPLTALR